MNDSLTFFLILLLGTIGTWLFFYEAKEKFWEPSFMRWARTILQPLGCLISFSIILRLVKDNPSHLNILGLLIVLVGFLITRNYLGLNHWRKTGDRAGLWSTIGLDALVFLFVMVGLSYRKFY